MNTEIYKKIFIINSCPFNWIASFVLVFKPRQIQLYFTFNYHFIYKDILASHIKVVANVSNLLNILSYQSLFLANIKYKYWVINIYLNNYHHFIFYIPKIKQIQLIWMSQKAKTSSFLFDKLINIILISIFWI